MCSSRDMPESGTFFFTTDRYHVEESFEQQVPQGWSARDHDCAVAVDFVRCLLNKDRDMVRRDADMFCIMLACQMRRQIVPVKKIVPYSPERADSSPRRRGKAPEASSVSPEAEERLDKHGQGPVA